MLFWFLLASAIIFTGAVAHAALDRRLAQCVSWLVLCVTAWALLCTWGTYP